MCEPTSEIWLPVVGWEGFYEVSDLGRVRRIFLPPFEGYRVLRPSLCTYHPSVSLSRRSRVVRRTVHVLVAAAFLGPRPPGLEVCHNDGNKMNAAASNLRYDTHQANEHDKRIHGTHHNSRKTHCPYGHEYTPANTYINAKGSRECRTCIERWHQAEAEATKAARRARGLRPHPNAVKTHCPEGHPYDEENTYIIPSTGGRMCRICILETSRRARKRKRSTRSDRQP
jgi:hypothetical protein